MCAGLRELGEELISDFDQVGERDTSAQGGGGNGQEGETTCGRVRRMGGRGFGDVVDVVVAVGIGQFLRVDMVDLGENKGGKRGGL